MGYSDQPLNSEVFDVGPCDGSHRETVQMLRERRGQISDVHDDRDTAAYVAMASAQVGI